MNIDGAIKRNSTERKRVVAKYFPKALRDIGSHCGVFEE
jgi:hypothetical protein